MPSKSSTPKQYTGGKPRNRKKATTASEVMGGMETPLEASVMPPESPNEPETPFDDPPEAVVVDAKPVDKPWPRPRPQVRPQICPQPNPTPDTLELVAYCPHCGKGVKSEDWNKIATWFGEHCQQAHPDIFTRLFAVASGFLGLMIADMYETTPDWNDQPSMQVLREELVEIMDGDRDPLEDGLS